MTMKTRRAKVMVLEDETFGRWLGHKGAALRMISALMRTDMEHASSLCVSILWGYNEKRGHLWTRRRARPRAWPCRHPDLRLPASRTVRNKYTCCLNPPVYSILWLRQKAILIRKEEIKLLSFADDMIIYIEIQKSRWKRELKSNYSKIAGHKVNIQKSTVFLIPATNKWNLKPKHNAIYISTLKNEILRYESNKCVQGLYEEN